MKFKNITIVFIIFFLSLVSYAETYLSRKVYEIPEEAVYKYGVDITTAGEEIFVLENIRNRILKYRVNGKLKFVRTIGQKGTGPSDVYLPIQLSLWNGILAVKDEIGVSFFDTNGKYLDKFRLFTPYISFVYVKDKIFYLSSSPERPSLVGVYARNGKSLMNFGRKFLDLKSSDNKISNPYFVERYFYKGKLLSDGNFIFYLSSKFGKVFKFNLEGKKIEENDFQSLAGEKGKRIVNENNKLVKNGLKRNRDGSYNVYSLFHDAFLFEDKIYLLIANIFDPTIPLEELVKEKEAYIAVIDTKNLKPGKKKYWIKLGEDERLHSFAVTRKERRLIFFTSMYTKEGTEIVAFYE